MKTPEDHPVSMVSRDQNTGPTVKNHKEFAIFACYWPTVASPGTSKHQHTLCNPVDRCFVVIGLYNFKPK